MSTVKESAIEAIKELPENATHEDIMVRIYVLENIHDAEREEAAGKLVSNDEIGKRIEQWTKKSVVVA